MHARLFLNGTHITNYVDSYYIVGVNKPTVTEISADVTGETGKFENIKFYKNNAGDGTVPVWSANIGGSFPNKTYYAYNREHGGEYDFETSTI